MSLRRLSKESEKISKNPPPGCTAAPMEDGNLYKWQATIRGPPDSPYEGGLFALDITFPLEYPFHPPKVTFITKIFHPNVSPAGTICLDILEPEEWSPALDVSRLLLSITSLLCDPGTDDGLNLEASTLWRCDRDQYMEVAREWTEKWALNHE